MVAPSLARTLFAIEVLIKADYGARTSYDRFSVRVALLSPPQCYDDEIFIQTPSLKAYNTVAIVLRKPTARTIGRTGICSPISIPAFSPPT